MRGRLETTRTASGETRPEPRRADVFNVLVLAGLSLESWLLVVDGVRESARGLMSGPGAGEGSLCDAAIPVVFQSQRSPSSIGSIPSAHAPGSIAMSGELEVLKLPDSGILHGFRARQWAVTIRSTGLSRSL